MSIIGGDQRDSLGVVIIVAAFDAATPANTRSATRILPTIQPAAVPEALEHVYARFVDWIRMVRHGDKHVVSVCRVVPDTATFKTAVVGSLVFGRESGTSRFVLHYAVVA